MTNVITLIPEDVNARPATSLEVMDRAQTIEAMRDILRDWLLYSSTIPSPASEAGRAVYAWTYRVHTERYARIAASLIALKAAGRPTDVHSLIAYLDLREELIGAGGRAFIIDLISAARKESVCD